MGGFTWLDLSPADFDMFAIPDTDSLTQLPWKKEVGWLAADLSLERRPLQQAPRNVLKRAIVAAAEQGFAMKSASSANSFHRAGRPIDFRPGRHAGQALLRPAGPDAPLTDVITEMFAMAMA